MSTETAVLADCRTRSGLAVARSLGRRGVRVIAIASDTNNPAAKSRYVAQALCAPDPVAAPFAYAARVAGIAAEQGARLVIPITDAATSALDASREAFAGAARLALPPREAVRQVLDKRANLALARRLGVPCPREFELRSRAQSREMVETLGFPLVVKSAEPDGLDAGRRLPFRVAIANDTAQLERILDVVDATRARPVYQAFVRGRSISVCTFAVEGSPVAMHAYVSQRRSLHEGIAREIVALDPELAGYATRVVGALGWTGLTHMQFFVDEARGTCAYMETNGRFWASTQGTVNAGWDVPYWHYRYHTEGVVPDVTPIRIGCRTVYRKEDFRQLYRLVVKGQVPPGGRSGRLAAIWQSLRDLAPSVYSDVWQWDDPLPGIYDYRDLLSRPATPPRARFREVVRYSPDGTR